MEDKQLGMAEILSEVEKMSSRKDKIAMLKKHYSKHMHEALAFAYDDRVQWLLPKGKPPYTPLESEEAKMNLHRECRLGKLYYFVQGGKGQGINGMKREMMFTDLLESVDPEDAKLLVALKEKQIPYRGVTKKLIEEAWGELE